MLVVRQYGRAGRSPVVLLHGGPGAAGHMAPVALRLADSYRIFEPFQRRRDAQPLTVARHVADLHDVIKHHELGQPALIGSSWGAMLALAYAAVHPEATGPIILVGCGTFDPVARAEMKRIITERTDDAIRARLKSAEGLDPDSALKETAKALVSIYSYNPMASPHDKDEVDARAHEETWDDMMRLQTEGVYPSSFAAIKVPVLMVHGTHDPHPGRLIMSSLKPYLSQIDYHELDRCGHYPWIEREAAAVFFALVTRWLTRQTTL
jgi:pimeloyl-ACP methyl ester carboxylesterase